MIKPIVWVTMFSAVAIAADPRIIAPRDSAAAYPAHAEMRVASVGAALLTADQVHGSFSSDLNRAYLVVEVGLFPHEQIDVSQLDFTLLPAGTQVVLRPVQPKVVAAVLQKPLKERQKASAPGDITVYPTVGVGYETGSVYDPATGRRRAGGWTTAAGVGVGIGDSSPTYPPPPGSSPADRQTMETELTEKGLADAPAVNRPVAGYLYFPFPGKKKDVAYDLEYRYRNEKVRLPLGKYSSRK
jgi:hypothetical protein